MERGPAGLDLRYKRRVHPVTRWIAGSLLLVATRASATASSRLVYARMGALASACPAEVVFRAAVRERLGYEPFFPWAPQTVAIEISENGVRLRARLRLIGDDGIVRGARDMDGSSGECAELVNSLALATSIALDPMAAAESRASPGSTSPGPQPSDRPSEQHDDPEAVGLQNGARQRPPKDQRSPIVTAEDTVRPPMERRKLPTRVALSVRAGALVSVGIAPSPAVGGRIGVLARWHVVALGAELRADVPNAVSSALGGRADVQFYGGALAPCITGRVLAGCALVLAGALRTRGVGVANAQDETNGYLAAGLRVEAMLGLTPRLDLVLNIDGQKTLTPVDVYLHDERVWATPPVSVATGATLDFHFL
jgi:hypothetical protein